MISVVITIIVMVLYKVYITNKENNKRIKELEERLDEYYKRRENKLMDRFRDIQ
jgi:septation ring formation regulator EzrA